MGDEDPIPFVDDDPRPDAPPGLEAPPAFESPLPAGPVHPLRYTFSGAFATGWEVLKANYGLLLGTLILYILIVIAAGFAAGLVDGAVGIAAAAIAGGRAFIKPGEWLVDLLVTAPLNTGLLMMGATMARRQRVELNDLFGGFRRYGQVLLALAAPTAIGIVMLIPAVLLVGVLVVGSSAPTPSTVGPVIIAYLIGWAISLYFKIRWMPAALLVIDTQAPEHTAMEALRVSWRMTSGRVLSLFCLSVVLSLINIVCALLLCLPALFLSGPLIVGVAGAAYSMLAHERGVVPIDDYDVCPYCGYDLSNVTGSLCPECGNARPDSLADQGIRPIVY